VNYQTIRVDSARLSLQELTGAWRMTLPVTQSLKLLLVLSGSACLRTASQGSSDEEVTLLAGHLHLSLPGEGGEVWAAEDATQSNCRLISGVVDVSSNTLSQLIQTSLPVVAPHCAHDPRWLQLVAMVNTEVSSEADAPAKLAVHSPEGKNTGSPREARVADEIRGATEARLVEVLLIRLLAMQQAEPGTPEQLSVPDDKQLLRCLELISARLNHHWTLATIAAEAGMSRSALARRFHHELGKTPMAYVNEQRLLRAKSVLKTSQLSVSQIANNLGYSTDAVFRRSFRRATGESPSEFRNKEKRTHS